MNVERDTQLLREHEAELRDIEKRVAALQLEREAVQTIVHGYRKRLSARGVDAGATRRLREALREATQPKRPGKGLKLVLREMLESERVLTVDTAFARLAQAPEWRDAMPSRNTLVSRLGDLVREGVAGSNGHGTYTLIERGQENGHAAQEALA